MAMEIRRHRTWRHPSSSRAVRSRSPEADGALDRGLAGQAQHAPAEGRLARSRLAEDPEALAGGIGQRKVVDGPDGRRARIGDPQLM